MIRRKIWFFYLTIGVLVLGMASCQATNNTDEEARAQIATLTTEMATMQANLNELNTQTTDISEQVVATQATTEALVSTISMAGGTTEATQPSGQSDLLGMSLKTALEVIYQDGQPSQGTYFPIDRLAFYNSYNEFEEDYTDNDDKNLQSWLKLAFLPNPTTAAWHLYYNTDVISDTVTWASPSWRRHLVKVNWQPDSAQSESGIGQLWVDSSEKSPINGQTMFLTGSFMREGLDFLEDALANNEDLTMLSPMMFLIHDSFEGRDDLVLAIVENSASGPDPLDDSPARQYCGRCQSFWCRWRCWRY